MIRIALVDDESTSIAVTSEMLKRCLDELGEQYELQTYDSSLKFISKYHGEFDLILLDIAMPGMDGLELARKIRAQDNNVALMFITTMDQYAINGYEVDAIGFMVKPVSYFALNKNLKKAIKAISGKSTKKINLFTKQSTTTLSADSVLYIEVKLHNLIFHTAEQEYTSYGTLSALEDELKDYNFSRCSNSYLVNLKYASQVKGDFVTVGKDEIPISRTYKKRFMEDLLTYIEKR